MFLEVTHFASSLEKGRVGLIGISRVLCVICYPFWISSTRALPDAAIPYIHPEGVLSSHQIGYSSSNKLRTMNPQKTDVPEHLLYRAIRHCDHNHKGYLEPYDMIMTLVRSHLL